MSHRAERLLRVFGIPRISAEAAAVFRVVVGTALLAVLLNGTALGVDLDVLPLNAGTGYGAGQWPLAHWIYDHPDVRNALFVSAIAATLAFVVGLFTRLAAALVWCSLFLLLCASLVTSGNHTWGTPWVALFGLPLAPLGDAWSVDALRRRARERAFPTSSPSTAYGFPIWWMSFVVGVAFLAAAFSKLQASGFAWVTTGAVRYHFIEDAGHAVVPWGIWIAGRPWLPVVLSAAALCVEATLIAVVFCRRDRYRVAAGAALLSMYLFFHLFQGVLWWPWVVLAVAFFPWETISRRLAPAVGAAGPGRRLTMAHAAAIAVLVATQVYASARAVEYEPLLSNYPMYRGTYASWQEFFGEKQWTKYQTYRFLVRASDGARVDLGSALQLLSPADADRLIDTTRALYTGDSIESGALPIIGALHARLREHFGREVPIEVVVDVRAVDFEGMRIGPVAENLHAFTLSLSPPALEFVAPEFVAAYAPAVREAAPAHR